MYRVLDPSYHLCGVDSTLSYLYKLDVVNVANKVRISCSYLELIDVCFEFARRKSLLSQLLDDLLTSNGCVCRFWPLLLLT